MVPDIFCNLVNFEILKLDKLLIPMLNTTKWSSTAAMDIMLDVKKNFDHSEAFIKRVNACAVFLAGERILIYLCLLTRHPNVKKKKKTIRSLMWPRSCENRSRL